MLEFNGKTIKSVYLDGKKIKKIYLDDRLVFNDVQDSIKQPEYYGTAPSLQSVSIQLAAASTKNHALFGGGTSVQNSSGKELNIVNAYNKELTKTNPEGLSGARCLLQATHVGSYVLFSGGSASSGSGLRNTVDVYDDQLIHSTAQPLSAALCSHASACGLNRVWIGGGRGETTLFSNVVNIYDEELTLTVPTPLSQGRVNLAAVCVGNHVLFCGGQHTNSGTRASAVVDAYDAELVRTTPTPLGGPRTELNATNVNDYAIIVGGNNGDKNLTVQNTVWAYDKNLTRHTADPVHAPMQQTMTTTLKNYSIFAQGTEVDLYDNALTHSIMTTQNPIGNLGAATTINDYALLGGGYSLGLNRGSPSATVNVIAI